MHAKWCAAGRRHYGTDTRRIWNQCCACDCGKCNSYGHESAFSDVLNKGKDYGRSMKQVMEYYGGAIIAVIVAAAVLALFWKLPYEGATGVPEILGKVAGGTLTVSNETTQTSAFTEYMSSTVPEITVNLYTTCLTDTWNYIKTYFSAVAATGRRYPVQIESGWSVEDSSIKMTVSEDGNSFFCTYPGEYWVSVCTALPSGRTRTEIRKLVVNKEVVS